jgi:hypothetical protein
MQQLIARPLHLLNLQLTSTLMLFTIAYTIIPMKRGGGIFLNTNSSVSRFEYFLTQNIIWKIVRFQIWKTFIHLFWEFIV